VGNGVALGDVVSKYFSFPPIPFYAYNHALTITIIWSRHGQPSYKKSGWRVGTGNRESVSTWLVTYLALY